MTIAVRISNLESRDDESKELYVEMLARDETLVASMRLQGGQVELFYVHPNQSLRLSERFIDKLKV